MNYIGPFTGLYSFLSNFYPCQLEYKGIEYLNSEAAFQAQKCVYECDKSQFKLLNARDAKKRGKKIKLRDDWEQVKDEIMYEVLTAKFSQNEDLKEKLLNTGDIKLVEINYWGGYLLGRLQ